MPPIPAVTNTTQDGNTGSVPPSTTNVLLVIGFLSSLTAALPVNVATSFTRVTDIQSAGGAGPGLELSAYYINAAKKPVLLVAPTCTTVGAYGTIATSKTGTFVPAAGGTAPVDDFDVTITFVNGGTLGTTGIAYTYTLDNGGVVSAVQSLGTGTTIGNLPLPNNAGLSGVSFSLGIATETVIAGDSFRVQTTRPQMQNSDLVTALAAAAATALPWDNALIDIDLTATTAATIDGWLTSIQAQSQYKGAWLNVRHKLTPAPTAETESAYATFLSTQLSSFSTIQCDVGADGAYTSSYVTGLRQVRPTSMFIAARANVLPVGVDPAWVQLGAVPNCQITNPTTGAPQWHDERIFPGLDALRYSTLCTLPGFPGVYIGNARIFSNSTSDFQFDQHMRAMNAAKTVAYPLEALQLSRGIRKQAPDPNTGAIYILEDDAAAIEGFINPELQSALQGQVNGVLYTLDRNNNIGANSGANVTSKLQIQALAYIKALSVVNEFVPTIQTVTSTNTSGVAGS